MHGILFYNMKIQLLNTSHLMLRRLAALVWYIGVLVLAVKSSSLMLEADKTGIHRLWIILAFGTGILIGWVKAKYMFERLCLKNLKRIYALKKPRIWQFYRPRFFVFLFLMVSLGKYLPGLIEGNNLMLILLAILELSIAVALLISSHCFWKRMIQNKDLK